MNIFLNPSTEAEEGVFSTACIVETSSFLRRLLPVEERLIEEVFDRMKVQGYYSDGRWSGFPNTPAERGGNSDDSWEAILAAFVDVANAIRKAAEQVTKAEGDSRSDHLGANEWVDYRARAPLSENKGDVGPNAHLVLTHLQEDLDQMPVWWYPVVAVVRMKQSEYDSWRNLLEPLLGDLQNILRSQLDRRFAFGFTLGSSQLSIWMQDRSGPMGTETSIDIHEDPGNFIRLIAGFVALPARKLGYDPNMEIYDRATGIAMPSYKLSKPVEHHGQDDRPWVIRLNDGSRYLTVKALKISRAEIFKLHETGSVVWVVVPYCIASSTRQAPEGNSSTSGDERQPRQVFVLKQYWRPLGHNSEGHVYNCAKGSESNFIGAIVGCEDAMIEGEKDDTGDLIRQGLVMTLPPHYAEQRRAVREMIRWGRRNGFSEGPGELYPTINFSYTDPEGIRGHSIEDPRDVISQIRTRFLSSTYGWPIKCFSTLGELLRVLQGAIQGHKYLYANGVLHRNINPENIIIEWQPGSPITATSSRGCLIGLDRARVGEKIQDVLVPEVGPLGWGMTLKHPVFQDAPEDITDMVVEKLGDVQEFEIQEDVIVRAFGLPGQISRAHEYTADAIEHALVFGYLPGGGSVSCRTLRWDQVKKSYNYRTYPENEPVRPKIGTPPYMSGEILYDDHYLFCGGDSIVHHDAVHDIESFFWVLVKICLDLKGPGESRDELVGDPEIYPEDPDYERIKRLWDVLWQLFDSGHGRNCKYKRRLFQKPELFETEVLPSFHPTFDLLKPLVLEWFSVLRIAYVYRSHEYHTIHDRVLAIFDKVLDSMGSQLDELEALGTQVLKARQEDIDGIIGVSRSKDTSDAQAWGPGSPLISLVNRILV